MSFYDSICSRYQELLQQKCKLQALLSKAPSGSLGISKQGSCYYFRHCYDQKQPEYIKSSNRVLARRLAAKAIRKRKLSDVENELDAIEAYLKRYDGKNTADEFLRSHEAYRILAEEWGVTYDNYGIGLLHNSDWINRVKTNPYAYKLLLDHAYRDGSVIRWRYESELPGAAMQEARTIKTLCGIMVRSKSEAMYADELYRSGILFIYEAELIINGIVYHPDFLIFHPVTGELIIFEYMGLLPTLKELNSDNTSNLAVQVKIQYQQTNAEKIKNYILAGFLPGRTLLIMSETDDLPFDTSLCQRFVSCYFKE